MLSVLLSLLQTVRLSLRSRAALHLEILALRHQVQVLQRSRRRVRLTDADRLLWVWLSRIWTEWRSAVVIVRPETVIAWHRRAFRLLWTWKSRHRLGRPAVSADIRALIRTMSRANPLWGAPRIHGELVKLGIEVSEASVTKYLVRSRRYMPAGNGSKRGPGFQAWSSFVRNHGQTLLACDFFVTATTTFRVLYIFVILEVGTRRILHWNVTDHPTAEWTSQQFRMVGSGDQSHRYVVHDHDSMYSEGVDRTIAAMGRTVLQMPVRAPQANAFCERLIGTIRRECLDFVIPLNERHMRRLLREWVVHDNRGRPHSSLGRGIPDPPPDGLASWSSGHQIREGHRVVAAPVLGGLHHEYRLEPIAA